MTKLEFLKYFFDNKGYGTKAALQSMIGIQFEDSESSGLFKEIPFAVYVENSTFWTLVDDQPVKVDGNVEEPLFTMHMLLSLPGDFHPWFKGKAYDTTFGLFLFNVVLFWEVFKGKVDYVNEEFTGPLIEGIISNQMVDTPPEGEEVPEGKSDPQECLQFTKNCYFLEGLGSHFIKPGGIDILQISPAILKRKAELLEQYKDQLHDPILVEDKIVKPLVEMDKLEQLSGPSKDFFIKGAFIDNSRKRMFIMFGIEPNPEGDGWIALTNSLDEGLDPNQLVHYINTAVVGSYSRSMATGDGGAEVKNLLQLVGRFFVFEDDCNTPVTETIMLTPITQKQWLGSYHMVDKTAVKLTKENVKGFLNKPLKMRVTQFCITKDSNYCKTCCGEGLGAIKTRMSAEVVLIATAMMLQRMKAAHVAGNKTVELDMDFAIKD